TEHAEHELRESPDREESHHGLRAAGAEAVEGNAIGRLRRDTAIEDGAKGDTRLEDQDWYEEPDRKGVSAIGVVDALRKNKVERYRHGFIVPGSRWWMGRSRNALACVAGLVPDPRGS